MKRIYKYPLDRGLNRQLIHMPMFAQIVSIQGQGDVITIWAIVDPNQATESRYFWVIYTGSPIHEPTGGTKLHYLATVVMDSRGMVYHVFEEAPKIQPGDSDYTPKVMIDPFIRGR